MGRVVHRERLDLEPAPLEPKQLREDESGRKSGRLGREICDARHDSELMNAEPASRTASSAIDSGKLAPGVRVAVQRLDVNPGCGAHRSGDVSDGSRSPSERAPYPRARLRKYARPARSNADPSCQSPSSDRCDYGRAES